MENKKKLNNNKIIKKKFNQISILSKIISDKEVYQLILENLKSADLKSENKIIIKTILNSYEKKFKNIKLIDSDFLLEPHELNSLINKKNLIRYLIYRYKYNILPKIKKIENYPPIIQLELTSVCNLRCVMCYQSDKTFSSRSSGFMGYMNFDLFKKIIDEINGNVDALTFGSRGEPTLVKDLDKYLKYCEGKFYGLKLNTNATMLNEKIIHTLLSSDLEVLVLSIDEIEKEKYEKIRVKSNFNKVIKNLQLLQNIKSKYYQNSKTTIRVSGVKINSEQNFSEMKNFYSEFSDEISFVDFNPWNTAYENKINSIKKPCTELWRTIYIWWNGDCNPCDFDYKSLLKVDNCKNKLIKDIWNSETYNNLRVKHLSNLRKKLEPCKRCIMV